MTNQKEIKNAITEFIYISTCYHFSLVVFEKIVLLFGSPRNFTRPENNSFCNNMTKFMRLNQIIAITFYSPLFFLRCL